MGSQACNIKLSGYEAGYEIAIDGAKACNDAGYTNQLRFNV